MLTGQQRQTPLLESPDPLRSARHLARQGRIDLLENDVAVAREPASDRQALCNQLFKRVAPPSA